MLFTAAANAATMTDRLGEAITLAIVGMLVVFTALCLTAVVIVLLNRWDDMRSPPEPGTPATDGPRTARSDQQRLIAVIAAAATAAIGAPVRVRDVQPAGRTTH